MKKIKVIKFGNMPKGFINCTLETRGKIAHSKENVLTFEDRSGKVNDSIMFSKESQEETGGFVSEQQNYIKINRKNGLVRYEVSKSHKYNKEVKTTTWARSKYMTDADAFLAIAAHYPGLTASESNISRNVELMLCQRAPWFLRRNETLTVKVIEL